MTRLIVLLAAFFSASLSAADCPPARSQTEKIHFAKQHPCPVTNNPVTSCKGYVIDHVVPLCAGGKDVAANMMWQEYVESLEKDSVERAYCQCVRRQGKDACPTIKWK